MRVIKLTIEYDGTEFSGWQVQPGMRTVQGAIEDALFKFTGERISAEASGRTDAGVHALGQVVSFRTESGLDTRRMMGALNALLPEDVAALEVEEADPDFHARRSARGKTYRYAVLDGGRRTALDRRRAWTVPSRLDVGAMRKAAALLEGERDFSSFRASGCEAKGSVRDLRRLEVYRDSIERVIFEAEANGFLKQMVRALVGTLVEVGSGKRAPDEMRAILESLDRSAAGQTAPPWGLYLVSVKYY